MAPSEEGPSADVGLGIGTADETTAADDALEPFNVADPIEMRRLALTIDALTALDPKTFDKDPMYRPIRRSLEPLNRRFADRHAAILEKERGKQLRREAEGRKARQAEMDRRHRDTTRLRLGRIERLRELERGASNGGAAGALLLPGSDSDGGCGDTDGRGDVSDATAATRYLSQVPDGAVKDLPRDALDAPYPSPSSAEELNKSKQCYTCKARFTKLHHFYAQLCPSCAGVNFEMRNFEADLTGKTALLTGARVKIGYEIGLKLLRAGACLIATTRFPADAARRYAAETDFEKFRSRLTVYSVDLRDVAGVERFCDHLKATLPRLDIIVNNACQTVRRPASYYAHLLPLERSVGAAMRSGASVEVGEHSSLVPLLSADASRRASEGQSESSAPTPTSLPTSIDMLEMGEYYPSAAELSQLKIAPEDHAVASADLPPGHLDVNGQQIDLRTTNSWLLKLQDVSVPELVEVMAINALAPFLLNSRLQPLMASTPGHVFVVNVSAMEGKFYRHKTANHPHTNMAKAALNMMTRTSAKDLAEKDGIYMTAVDTGWINDENPRDKAARIAESAHFQTPIDEVDAAARVLHPVFHGVSTKEPLYGVFLKDFIATEW